MFRPSHPAPRDRPRFKPFFRRKYPTRLRVPAGFWHALTNREESDTASLLMASMGTLFSNTTPPEKSWVKPTDEGATSHGWREEGVAAFFASPKPGDLPPETFNEPRKMDGPATRTAIFEKAKHAWDDWTDEDRATEREILAILEKEKP